jgi:tetratricopeptide (TPR) repeat protein
MANPALIDELEKQFRDNPRRVFARLANEYRKGGDFIRAIEICHAHVPQQPGYISGHIVLGQALYDAGELDQAQQTFEAALALDPENLIALRQLGDIARSRRDYRDARGWYTRLLEVDPQNEEIVAQLGELALSENAHGIRNGDSTGAQDAQLQDIESGVAVADDEASDAAAPAVVDDAPADEMYQEDAPPQDHAARMDVAESRPVAEPLHGYFGNGAGADDSEPPMLDIEDLEVEPSFSTPEGLTTAVGEPVTPSDDDEEIAWVAAEGTVEPDLVLEYEELDETDDTEIVIAAEARDEEIAGSAEGDDDLDFAFEPEEYETPLRPHTGESLSVLAEEDPLAGVHTGPWEDRSPFGTPLESEEPSGNDETSASFEPLPESEIDASASDSPPNPSGATREADRFDEFDLGDAETLVDEASVEFAWDSAPADPVPDTPSAWERPAPQPDGVLMEWEPDSPSESDANAVTARDAGRASSDAEPDGSDRGEAVVLEANADENAEQPGASPAPDADHATESDAADEATKPDDSPAAQAEGGASAFVTETMAQLYLQQGFRSEALDVYRKLAAQSPDDEQLRERIADLEGGPARAEAAVGAGKPSGERTPAVHRTAASFFKGLASKPAPVAPPPATAESTDFGAWVDEALSEAGEIPDVDQVAATALANAFSPEGAQPVARGGATRAAEHEMSLNDVFGARQRSESGSAAASMDAFFTPEGERARDASGEGDSPEDLEAFNAWLEGLKK